MQTRISRLELVKSMSGITIGAGITALPFHRSLIPETTNDARLKINVKVSPPGPKSLELLGNVRKYIGRTNYAGLYGVGLKNGEGVYIEDVDGNVYLDYLTATSSNILGYGHHEITKTYYDQAMKIRQT